MRTRSDYRDLDFPNKPLPSVPNRWLAPIVYLAVGFALGLLLSKQPAIRVMATVAAVEQEQDTTLAAAPKISSKKNHSSNKGESISSRV